MHRVHKHMVNTKLNQNMNSHKADVIAKTVVAIACFLIATTDLVVAIACFLIATTNLVVAIT